VDKTCILPDGYAIVKLYISTQFDEFPFSHSFFLEKRRLGVVKSPVLPPAGQGISTAKSLINPVPLGHRRFPRPSSGFAWAGQIEKPDDLTALVYGRADVKRL
jgi:hypothetical protein